ncbi:class I SAM-dependent methyltransferase [Mycolicibacterium baixiangningiae]|uniref:class I SAM-dependent methyltransferase n=1 Tax=Mycolicibacterium baixiangningiae TaxID=2761578 RepID=UPI001866E554|nr:class I SAM-dependent methyltransferase [Mycolicibacterium baixiangningiae]
MTQDSLDFTSTLQVPETVEDCEKCLHYLEASTQAISEHIRDLEAGSTILDLACGTGEPGLGLVEPRAGWRLIGIDGSLPLIEVARMKAKQAGLEDRAAFEVMLMDALRLPDASVNAVISRMGALLLGDPAATAREIARVLKPGGRVSIAVWAEAELNPFVFLTQRALATAAPGTSLPDLSGWFRQMATPGIRERWLLDAGLIDVQVKPFEWNVVFEDFESWWSFVSGGPHDAVISALDDRTRDDVRAAMSHLLREYERPSGDGFLLPVACQIVRASKAPE